MPSLRRVSWKLAMRALLSIALVLLLSTGCMTEWVLEQYESAPLGTVELELLDARPNEVRFTWRARYVGVRWRSGVIDFDPRLSGCSHANVYVRQREADVPLTPNVRTYVALEARSSSRPPPQSCSVVLQVSRLGSDTMSLQARNELQRVGHTTIQAPHNHLWLAVVPVSATADVVTVLAVACVMGACLAMLDGYSGTF